MTRTPGDRWRMPSSHGVRRMFVPALGLLITILVIPLNSLGDLRTTVVPFLALVTAATLALYAGAVIAWRANLGVERFLLLGVALGLRLAVLPMTPSLSDDVYRYLWDGRLVLHGEEPFSRVPADTAFALLHDDLYDRQAYPTTNTIYPPGAQLLFAASMAPAELAGTSWWLGYFTWKLFVVFAELAAIALMARVIERSGGSLLPLLLYAWHPLAVMELAGQGHTDAFWVLAIALGLWGYSNRAAGGGLPGLAVGAVTRLHPLTLMPLWLRGLGWRRGLGALVRALPVLLVMSPLAIPAFFVPYTTVLERFTNHYEFNGGFYLALKSILDGEHIKPSNAIAGGAGTALALVLLVALWVWPMRDRSVRGLARRALAVVTAQIVFGAKIHVWYFVAPLVLAAFVLAPSSDEHPNRGRAGGGSMWLAAAWMWAALAGPFTYLMYAATPAAERFDVAAVEWGGFVALALVGLWHGVRGGRRGRSIGEA